MDDRLGRVLRSAVPAPAGPQDGGGAPDVDRWVVHAQDGRAEEVLARTANPALLAGLTPERRGRALYARALAHLLLGHDDEATRDAVGLVAFCRDHGLAAQGLLARAFLVEMHRRGGRLAEAVEELARAVAQEPALQDVEDPRTQSALGALAVALRAFGVADEARRVEDRLAAVEQALPRDQRVSRWSNLAIDHAIAGMASGRVAPFAPDEDLLARAVREISHAVDLADGESYAVVVDEAAVLSALAEAVGGDPAVADALLDRCRGVLDRGAEAVTARLLWAAAAVRSAVRAGRREDAVTLGRHHLATVGGSGEAGDRMVLAYEVMRAEHPDCERHGTGAAEAVALAHRRARDDSALVGALFRARVTLWGEADERRELARRASLDSLTGVVNRRGAAAALEAASSRPAGQSLALLLVDLDRFRRLNDAQGHLAGDVVLQNVARGLRGEAPEDAVVARWGGDEFLVLVPVDAVGVGDLADRARERVREAGDPGGGAPVAASVGVAVRDAPLPAREWVSRAEAALRAAKRGGGDAVVVR